MRYLCHILNEPCYGPVSTVTYAVVERPICEFCLYQGPYYGVEVMLRYLHLHKSSYDLTRPWLLANEGIKKRVKRAVIDIIQKPHQVSLPMQLEVYAIYAPALVSSVSQIVFYDGINFHIIRP